MSDGLPGVLAVAVCTGDAQDIVEAKRAVDFGHYCEIAFALFDDLNVRFCILVFATFLEQSTRSDWAHSRIGLLILEEAAEGVCNIFQIVSFLIFHDLILKQI